MTLGNQNHLDHWNNENNGQQAGQKEMPMLTNFDCSVEYSWQTPFYHNLKPLYLTDKILIVLLHLL